MWFVISPKLWDWLIKSKRRRLICSIHSKYEKWRCWGLCFWKCMNIVQIGTPDYKIGVWFDVDSFGIFGGQHSQSNVSSTSSLTLIFISILPFSDTYPFQSWFLFVVVLRVTSFSTLINYPTKECSHFSRVNKLGPNMIIMFFK